MQTPFWLNNPTILLNGDSVSQVWPTQGMDANQKLNAITRLVLLLSLLGYLVTQNSRIIVTCFVTLVAIVILQYTQKESITKNDLHKVVKEGFETLNAGQLAAINYTRPSVSNPVMNVLLSEIHDNPTRPAAEPAFNPVVEKDINKKTQEFVVSQFDDKQGIDKRLFKDLGDKYEFDMSMHQWYATPSTTIPNDQKSFAEFCYGDMKSCKEGNSLACTQQMSPHWINGNH
jgi:hypothetical protein